MPESILLPGPDIVAVGMQFSYWAHHLADHPAIIDGDRILTYTDLNARSNQLVRALRNKGLQPDDTVAVMSRNCLEWGIILGATARGGYRYVPINWHLSAKEVAYILNDSEAKVVFHDIESSDVIDEARQSVPDLVLATCVDQSGEQSSSAFDELIAGESGADIPDPIFGTRMAYTSGTTGSPKGVYRPREYQRERAVELAKVGGFAVKVHYDPGLNRHLAAGPFYHSGPGAQSLVIPLNSGTTVIVMRSWDNEEFLRLIDKYKVTHTHVAPIIFQRLLKLPIEIRERYDLSSLIQLRHGGAPCPIPTKQAMIEWVGPVLDEYYGATEGSGTNVDSYTWLERPGTVGKVNPPEHIKIVGPEGQTLPAGEVGRIYIQTSGPTRFEYMGDKEKTASAYLGDYFTVNDVGYIDADGYLFLTDRSVDLIISGGVNIYPAEVEAVLGEHPMVGDVAVVGVPNDEWGEEVWAAIELTDPSANVENLEMELRKLCIDRLAKFKCPRVFRFEDQIPREDSGKLFKRKLRDQYRSVVGIRHSANS